MRKSMKIYLEELERVGMANAAVTSTMNKFLIERSFQGCPDWIESDFHLGGLVAASELLSDRTLELAEILKEEARK